MSDRTNLLIGHLSNNPTRSTPFTRDNLGRERGEWRLLRYWTRGGNIWTRLIESEHVEATPKLATCRQTEGIMLDSRHVEAFDRQTFDEDRRS